MSLICQRDVEHGRHSGWWVQVGPSSKSVAPHKECVLIRISGEIDILEGVNDQATNAMTLHTGPGCSISSSNLGFDGSIQTSNCDVNAVNQDKNAGCSIKSSHKSSYGAGLNAAQGGVYATELTDDAISIYFFTRSQIPSDLASENPDPSTWGTPAAKFSGGCDIASTFNKLQFVFDTTFCGDWAGNAWPGSSCASSTKTSTCKAYVANNPQAFKNAYWTVNSLRVYQNKGDAVPSPSYSASGPSRSVAPPASIPSSSKILTNTPSATAVPTSTGGRYHHHTRYSFSKSQASDSPIPTPSPSDFAHSSAPVSAPVSTDSLLISSNIVPTPSSPTGSPGGVKKGGMATAFQWPKAKQRSGSPAAPEPTQNKENKAPTTMTTITAPPAPVATNEKGQVVKTLVETIYVTVAPSAAGSRRAKQVRRHMVQENARR